MTDRGSFIDTEEISNFLEEAIIMKDFDHANVLSLLGVTVQNDRPYVILPLMEHGDLKNYVSKHDKVGIPIQPF